MRNNLIVTFIIIVFATPAGAGRTFTDSDLETYKQEQTAETKDRYKPLRKKETIVNRTNNSAAQSKKESWCRKGKIHRERINTAQRDLEKAEGRIEQYRKALSVRKSDLRSAMRTLKRSRERMKAAEEEYRSFEDRAYRQNIPRDWYECYYDGYDEYNDY